MRQTPTTSVTANIHTTSETAIGVRNLTDTNPRFVSLDFGAQATVFLFDASTARKLKLAAAKAERILRKRYSTS